MRNSLLLLCLALSCTVFAQKNTDTLIMKNGTIRVVEIENMGELIYSNTPTAGLKIEINVGQNKPEKISADDVQSIKFAGFTFDNIACSSAGKFMELIVDGKMKMYTSRTEMSHDRSKYNFKTGQWTTYVNDNSHLFVYNVAWYNNSCWNVTEKGLKKTYAQLFAECPKLVEKMNTKGFDFSDAEKFIREFNKCGN